MVFNFFKPKPTPWLKDYLPYKQPHAAASGKLSSAQADENLDYFFANKAARIETLAELLTNFKIDLKNGIDSDTPEPLVGELYQWSGTHWPEYFNKSLHTDAHWIASNKQDSNDPYSVILDTAIVLGDVIIKHRPSFAWGLDDQPGNKEMTSYNRCVLKAPWLPEPGRTVVIDIEAEVASRFLHADYSGQRHEALWLKLVNDCVSGGCEGAHLLS